MAQDNELMLRLLWKGRIIGLFWIHYDKRRGRLLEEYKHLVKPTGEYIDGFDEDNFIKYDSFELGIKIGDEWFFGEWTATQYGSHYFKDSIHDEPEKPEKE